jgi:hypothetical protein
VCGWVGLFLVVTATVVFAGAIYFQKVNNECFIEEVVSVSTQRWRDVDNGVSIETSSDACVFAQQLSEYSSAALLFALSESRIVGSYLWSNLKYFKPASKVFSDETVILENAEQTADIFRAVVQRQMTGKSILSHSFCQVTRQSIA